MPSRPQRHDVFDKTSTELSVVRHCENCMAIKVVRKQTGGESEWSDEKCFGMIFVSWPIFSCCLLQEELCIVFFFSIIILIMLLMSLHARAGSESNALVYAAIIIPLMFAVLAVLTLMCCKKYVKSLYFL